jgi:hypothetical protein
MKEADVNIDSAVDPDEVRDAPIGLGVAAGLDEAFPLRLRNPVRGKPRAEWPIATFWCHPWDLEVAEWLAAQGVTNDPSTTDLSEIAKQNRLLSQRLIDKGRGWSNLIRDDGSEWKYEPCSKENDGTRADPRVRLSEVGAYFGLIKARCISAAFTVAQEVEGNFESSSVSPTAGPDELKVKPIASREN